MKDLAIFLLFQLQQILAMVYSNICRLKFVTRFTSIFLQPKPLQDSSFLCLQFEAA